jgi:hypothetical protein
MNRAWIGALVVGAAGSLSLAAAVRHLYLRTVALREAMRPLRVQRDRSDRP